MLQDHINEQVLLEVLGSNIDLDTEYFRNDFRGFSKPFKQTHDEYLYYLMISSPEIFS
jgi:hypothetical protein